MSTLHTRNGRQATFELLNVGYTIIYKNNETFIIEYPGAPIVPVRVRGGT